MFRHVTSIKKNVTIDDMPMLVQSQSCVRRTTIFLTLCYCHHYFISWFFVWFWLCHKSNRGTDRSMRLERFPAVIKGRDAKYIYTYIYIHTRYIYLHVRIYNRYRRNREGNRDTARYSKSTQGGEREERQENDGLISLVFFDA